MSDNTAGEGMADIGSVLEAAFGEPAPLSFDANLAAQKLFSAEHEARVEWQYCEIKSEVGAVLSFKRLAGVLRMVSGVKNETRHVTYIEQAEAIKLRDKLNEWFPSPDTRDNG